MTAFRIFCRPFVGSQSGRFPTESRHAHSTRLCGLSPLEKTLSCLCTSYKLTCSFIILSKYAMFQKVRANLLWGVWSLGSTKVFGRFCARHYPHFPQARLPRILAIFSYTFPANFFIHAMSKTLSYKSSQPATLIIPYSAGLSNQ